MDGKYLERLEELLGLGIAHPKKLPFPTDYGRSMKNETPLNAEEHHLYRSCVGILLYMTPERPDLGFATKWLSGKLATPTRGDLAVLRHVAKYVKSYVTLCDRTHGVAPWEDCGNGPAANSRVRSGATVRAALGEVGFILNAEKACRRLLEVPLRSTPLSACKKKGVMLA